MSGSITLGIANNVIERIGHTGSNKTGVKCSTMPLMRFRQRSMSVGARSIPLGCTVFSRAVSELDSKSVMVTRL